MNWLRPIFLCIGNDIQYTYVCVYITYTYVYVYTTYTYVCKRALDIIYIILRYYLYYKNFNNWYWISSDVSWYLLTCLKNCTTIYLDFLLLISYFSSWYYKQCCKDHVCVHHFVQVRALLEARILEVELLCQRICTGTFLINTYTLALKKKKTTQLSITKEISGTSLVAQWLRICLPGLPWWRSGWESAC